MSNQRAKDQDVAAFTAPVWFIDQAKEAARQSGLKFSGWLRYCIALEVGYSRQTALILAQHPNVARYAMRPETKYHASSGADALNDAPISSSELEAIGAAAEAAAAELASPPAAQMRATAPTSDQTPLPSPDTAPASTLKPTPRVAAPTKPSRSQS